MLSISTFLKVLKRGLAFTRERKTRTTRMLPEPPLPTGQRPPEQKYLPKECE